MSRKRRKDKMSRYKCEFCGSIMQFSLAAKHFQEKHPDRFKQVEKKKFARVWNPRFDQDFSLKDASISIALISTKCPSCDTELYLIANDTTKKVGYLCANRACKKTIWIQKEENGQVKLVSYKN